MNDSKNTNKSIIYGVLFIAFIALLAVIVMFFLSPGEEQAAVQAISPDRLVENIKTGKFTGQHRFYHLKDTDIKTVLMSMSKDAGFDFLIKPGAGGKLTCDLDSIPWDEALSLFLEELDLEVKSTGSVVVVRQKVMTSPALPVMSAEQLIKNFKNRKFTGYTMDYHLKNQDLINLLKHMEKDIGLNFNIRPGVTGHVTCELDEVPWDEALYLFLEQNDMEMVLAGNALVVKKKGNSFRKQKKPDISPQQLMKNFKTRNYTGKPGKLPLETRDLADYIMHLARDTGLNIFIKSGVDGTVNDKMDNAPWDKALHFFLEQNRIEMKLEGTILVVQPKKKYPPM